MKKRLAAARVYIYPYGFLTQYVVESEDNRITSLYPLEKEQEDTEWIVSGILLAESSILENNATLDLIKEIRNKLIKDVPNADFSRMEIILV